MVKSQIVVGLFYPSDKSSPNVERQISKQIDVFLNNPLSNSIFDTLAVDSNVNNIGTFSVSNLFDNKSFSGSFLRKFKKVSTSQIKGYFGWGGLLLNISGRRADTLG